MPFLNAPYVRRTRCHIQSRTAAGELRVVDAPADLAVEIVGTDELTRFDPDGRLLFNANTPDGCDRARA